MLKGKTVAPLTLGCKVNQYETDGMIELLKEAGMTAVSFEEKADVYLINTCSVTNMADKKSRQMIHRAKKLNPDAVVIAAGCYVQAAKDKLMESAQNLFSKLYEQNGPGANAGTGAGTPDYSDGDVVDGDFTEV